MKKHILSLFLFSPFFLVGQNITGITPNQATQDSYVTLMISGNNMSFSGWSCWSNTANLSDFRFSQWSSPYLYGIPVNSGVNTLDGDLDIPAFQPLGVYNLEVFDCGTSNWIMFANSFQINEGSWDCVNNTCIDPGTGGGTFSSQTACMVACGVTPSWNCTPNIDPSIWNCTDPGDGTGQYLSENSCNTACSANSVEEDISNLLIYPNPAKNILTLDGDYISATIYDVFGKVVLTTYFYQNTIDVAALRNGIYFVHINTNNSISIKKITIAK
jgi:hypothetical protein